MGQDQVKAAVEPWVDAKTIGAHIGYGDDRVRALAREGKLPGTPMKNGARVYWRFKISVVEQFMNQQANMPPIA